MEKKVYQYTITKSIELFSNDQLTVTQRKGKWSLVEFENSRSLVVLLPWLNAKEKHAKKFIDLYLNKGYDVLKVQTTVWQVIWPMIGAQVTASDTLEFLHEHVGFQSVLSHGFSAGNYLWSEVLVKASGNMERYESTMLRVKGQVFDSPPGTPPIFQRGFAIALFPQNAFLCYLFERIITFQLYIFYNLVTRHLFKGHEVVIDPPTKTPSLMYISKDDPIAPYEQNMDMYRIWKSNGVKAFVKSWEHSLHVGHFLQHPEEYVEQLDSFLNSIGFSNQTGAQVAASHSISQVKSVL